uniref:Uncharacterized protein n=1 Tax=Rhizophora mucronata TaxID=61149 RepID=A0A2P2IXT2_RHIMU
MLHYTHYGEGIYIHRDKL